VPSARLPPIQVGVTDTAQAASVLATNIASEQILTAVLLKIVVPFVDASRMTRYRLSNGTTIAVATRPFCKLGIGRQAHELPGKMELGDFMGNRPTLWASQGLWAKPNRPHVAHSDVRPTIRHRECGSDADRLIARRSGNSLTRYCACCTQDLRTASALQVCSWARERKGAWP
jgi:hypothetical protein